jgi:hypothetical protein
MTYRDGLGPRWRRACDELEFERARLERLPPLALRRAPGALRARLDAAPEPGWFDPTTLAEVERAEGAVADLRAAIDEAEAFVAEALAAADAPAAPDPASRTAAAVRGERPAPPLGFFAETGAAFAESAAELASLLARYNAALWWTAYLGVEAQLEQAGAPYTLRLTWPQHEGDGRFEDFSLATPLPHEAPSFRLLPQTSFDDLLQALRLQKSHEVGDEEFDVRFRIVGDPACVGLFKPELRGALLHMAGDDVPSLTVGGGQALLRWSAPPSGPLLAAALRALAALRAEVGAR